MQNYEIICNFVKSNERKVSVERQYIAIDLKSFYASVECVERGLDPLDALLVVADESRTEKTICLAVSPALKAFGTGGRPRLFEVMQKVKDANRYRGHIGSSRSGRELTLHPELAIDYYVAPPRMAHYIDYSTRIYEIYLRYIAPEDIHVYSIDEVFIDATAYLPLYKMTAHDLAMTMIREVLKETGVTATAGIGTNLYLAKIAMDIVAKKMPPDKDGVRIAELDEMEYRRKLWNHTPLTDFWRVGKGIASRLAKFDILTMGDIALWSHKNEDFFYQQFGVNAELLIDHAWGWEPVTMDLVKAYRPETHSLCSGQVLTEAYTFDKARNVIIEMADAVSLDLLDKRLCTSQIVIDVGYDVASLTRPDIRNRYDGPVQVDRYGRSVPKSAHGTINIDSPTSSLTIITAKVRQLFTRIVNPDLLVRRLTITVNKLIHESEVEKKTEAVQLDLFTDYEELAQEREKEKERLLRERRRREAELAIKKRFGKNAILRGINFTDGATQRDRNSQIGGHHE